MSFRVASEVAWSIAVFTARETTKQLLDAVKACRAACRGRPVVIDVIVNGNGTLATTFSREFDKRSDAEGPQAVRVWHIALGDKSHAWNTYVHEIWPGGSVAFFIDGYVEVNEDALDKLEAGLKGHPHAMAATGLDIVGRSSGQLAKYQLEISGTHGNLYSLRRDAMRQVRESGFRLPLGLYRTDPTLDTCLKFNFDPSSNEWNQHRVLVVADANWKRPVLSPWKANDWLVHWRRLIRQAQGDVEQQALKTFWAVDKKRPNELPTTAEELIRGWVRRFPDQWRRLALGNPLRILAVRRAYQPRDWTQATIPPTLISTPKVRGDQGENRP